QGFDGCGYYRRLPDSQREEVTFIFEGTTGDVIGDCGIIGNGAAGLELDRSDPELGTPANALLLASSEQHSDQYRQVVEETFDTMPASGGKDNPSVRADLIYYNLPSGGAVFATGSIAWAGSLPSDHFDNTVSRITTNVLRNFLGKS